MFTYLNKKISFVYISVFLLLFSIVIHSCNESSNEQSEDNKITIVTTTTLVSDLVKNIVGSKAKVVGLMGAGVDPHLYKASESDVNKLYQANIIIYNGLHLESKLEDIFIKMQSRGKTTLALSADINKSNLINSSDFASSYDPHFWFHTDLWKQAATAVGKLMMASDTGNAGYYEQRLKAYIDSLTLLDTELEALANDIPLEKRILITAHDAFHYFGEKYDFKVRGLQGISTTAEAGVKDLQDLAAYIADNQIKAIFIETSVSSRNIEALQAAVVNKGFDVKLGGHLFSDALGSANTPEGTYLGMARHNMKTIVNALK